jgi:hypothetical protein
MAHSLLVATLLASSASELCGSRVEVDLDTEQSVANWEGESSMRNDDTTSGKHIVCPALNAFVQNHDLKTNGENVDADTVFNSLLRAGLNQPEYKGDPLPTGVTESNAFEYTFGVFLKNKAGNYRDKDGDLALPIYNFPGTNHEHNSHTGITTQEGVPFDDARWDELAVRSDRKLADGRECFSRDAWALAMQFFEMRDYDGPGTHEIDYSQVRSNHSITEPGAKWGGGWVVGKVLKRRAKKGNEVGGKRLVGGVAQVFNGMINLFWTGDYGHPELYKARAKQLESEEGKGLSFPWLDANFCLPVDELKALLISGTYPRSSGYTAMTEEEYRERGKVWKFPKSRCTATYFQEGHEGYDPEDACVDGEPPLVEKAVVASWAKRSAIHVMFGKR